jgi:ABC-2 type transport system ATP-binding protein
MAAVLVEGITKTYGKKRALSGLSFEVAAGSIYGLIGPNGAGKTTALSILSGLVRPTAGRAAILGIDVVPNSRKIVSSTGFCSPQFGLFDYLKGREILLACALMHGLSASEAENRARDLFDLLDLEQAAGHFVYEYSQGMRQKLGLACAFIHAPAVLLLDEPFVALDSVSVYRVVLTLRRMASSGRSVLLSSHDLALVQRVCNRVGILSEGVLKRETDLVSPADSATALHPQGATGESALESLLWEVVGAPDIKELSWI